MVGPHPGEDRVRSLLQIEHGPRRADRVRRSDVTQGPAAVQAPDREDVGTGDQVGELADIAKIDDPLGVGVVKRHGGLVRSELPAKS